MNDNQLSEEDNATISPPYLDTNEANNTNEFPTIGDHSIKNETYASTEINPNTNLNFLEHRNCEAENRTEWGHWHLPNGQEVPFEELCTVGPGDNTQQEMLDEVQTLESWSEYTVASGSAHSSRPTPKHLPPVPPPRHTALPRP